MEDLGVDGKEGRKEGMLGKLGWIGADCIHLGQDRIQWCALVNTVMNPRVP
jgi:hypothetical protein